MKERVQTAGTGKKIKVKVLNKTGDDRNGRILMIVEDESMGNNPRRFYKAVAPKDFPAHVGGYISKTREVSYVETHPETITEANKTYLDLVKGSKK